MIALAVLAQGIVPEGGTLTEQVLGAIAQLLGLAAVAGTLSGSVALLYRWYVREHVPTGLAVLVGLSAVAIYMGTTTALGQVIGDTATGDAVQTPEAILANLSAFAVGGAGAYLGIRIGERVGTDLFAATGGRELDSEVSEIVRTVGRVTSVTLPEDIADIVGYDPTPEATKEQLAGRRFLFPRRLTKTELHDRLVSRLKTDYGVGHVDLELSADATVEYLAVGSRAAGIGPTLPPATNAVAIHADPANAASAGDIVQVWEPNPLTRVLTGELRGVAGEVVTVAIDAADTQKLDPSTQYKLVTLPVQDRPDREFASLLRAADETLGTAAVDPGSDLAGVTVGALQVAVVAITREDAKPEAIPSRSRVLAPGDVIYAIATPDALRRLERAAAGDEPIDEPDPGLDNPTVPAPGSDDPAEGAGAVGSHPDDGTTDPEPAADPADGTAEQPRSVVDTLGGTPDTPTPDDTPSADGPDSPSDPDDSGDRDVDGPTEEDTGADETGTVDGTEDTDERAEPESDEVVDTGESDLEAVGEETNVDSSGGDAEGETGGADEVDESDTEPDDSGDPDDDATDPAIDTADNIFESINEGDEEVDLDALLQGDDEDVAVWDPDGEDDESRS